MNTIQLSNTSVLRSEEIIPPAPALGHSGPSANIGIVARNMADRIRVRQRSQIAAIVENGRDLLTMKKQLGDELFHTWLQGQCEISEHLAKQHMDFIIYFGDDINSVPDLPLEVLYKLMTPSITVSVWRTVLGYFKQGQRLTLGEIDRLIKEHQQADKRVAQVEKRAKKAEQAVRKAERQDKLTPQQRARRDLM
jgi:hypothetical protein